MKQLTELNSWKALEQHSQSIRLSTLFDIEKDCDTPDLFFCRKAQGLTLDFTYQNVTTTTIDLLLNLAEERQVKTNIDMLLNGGIVNQSENKPALHTALRTLNKVPIIIDGQDIIPLILSARDKMRVISDKIRAREWLGYSRKPITDIVNIGIGGSDLGPRFCIQALADISLTDLNYHFISDADPNAFRDAVQTLNPETTLFIVASKSFTTVETLYNTKKALAWIDHPLGKERHFIAVTANIEAAEAMGFIHILPLWSWVGGRYSLCSAINLITVIAIGSENFNQFLAGAHSMDAHFQQTDLIDNLPVLMALLGVWNNNFLNIHNVLILTYSKYLGQFVPYLQQLDMESNGKSIDNQGRSVNYSTGPIVWGGGGNQAQHSYYQLLCQGTHKITADLISLDAFKNEMIHTMCESNKRVLTSGVKEIDSVNGYIAGGTPLNHLRLNACSPETIGALVALYEHKIFVQGVLWNINSFDQPGVESAKKKKYSIQKFETHV